MIITMAFIFAAGAFLLLKKFKMGLILVGLAILWTLLVGIGLVPALLISELQSENLYTDPKFSGKSIIIVLGGGTIRQASDGRVVLNQAAFSRVYRAAELYFSCQKSSKECQVLASGGDPISIGKSEAEVMRGDLVAIGVPETDILTEDKSKDTFENALFSSRRLADQHYDVIALVTSGIHMRRARLYFANYLGAVVAAPADELVPIEGFIPRAYNLEAMDLALREYLGIARFHLYRKMGRLSDGSIVDQSE